MFSSFFYTIYLVSGNASPSFGTHVASLAEVPTTVVNREDVVSKDFAMQVREKDGGIHIRDATAEQRVTKGRRLAGYTVQPWFLPRTLLRTQWTTKPEIGGGNPLFRPKYPLLLKNP